MSIDLEAPGAAATSCANCATVLTGAYCHRCGQHAHVHRSLWHMLEEALHGVLNFDTKTWRTLPLLIARPGLLTRRYIDGQRVRYVPPLALFLFTVFLMFFVISQVDEQLTNVTVTAVPVSQLNKAEITRTPPAATAGTAGARPGGTTAAAGEPKSRLNIILELPLWADGGPSNDRVNKAVRNQELTLYKIKNTASEFSFMLIPISLPFLWLLFCRRRDVNMYDHVVFSLYSLSFMTLWVTILTLLLVYSSRGLLLLGMLVIPPVHMYLHLRTAYRLGWFAPLWRTAVLLSVASAVLGLFLMLVTSLSVR